MDKAITLYFPVVFKNTVCLRALLANSRQNNLLANDELQENQEFCINFSQNSFLFNKYVAFFF